MSEPTIFGRYQLIERLARGGMAEVFKAKLAGAAGTEKLVCIKRILPQLSRNNDFLALFVKEARIALPLTHGNITQVFDFGDEGGVYYLAMEYVAGPNLQQLLGRVSESGTRLALAASLFIAAEVCRGLQYAHSFVDPNGQLRPVVHRDVTPHNILVSLNGEVKLTDFGIALAATKVSGYEEAAVRGKACYLSPEQVNGHPGMPASDIFSLGAVLYEMLTGLRVFQADTESDTLERVRQAEVEPPSQLNPEVDRELDALVLKALARDPADRFAKAGELQVALSAQLHKHSPGFTVDKMSAILKDMFGWELSPGEGSGDPARDRLLFQLSRAGVKVDAASSTAELLDLGTVAIAGARPPRRRSWRLPAGIAGGLLLAVGVVVGLALLRPGAPSGSPPDASEEPLPLSYEETEQQAGPESAPALASPPLDQRTVAAGSSAGGERVRPRKPAYLNCNSWPWSLVSIDGRRLRGNTPFYRVRVNPGRHQIRFENPELGLSRDVSIQVEPGDQKTVAVSLHH